jgi:hypothetical protein
MKITKEKTEKLAGMLALISFMIAFYTIGIANSYFACFVPFAFGVGYLVISMMLHYSDDSN